MPSTSETDLPSALGLSYEVNVDLIFMLLMRKLSHGREMIKLWYFSGPRESKGWEWLRLACEGLDVKDEQQRECVSVCV